MTTHNEPPHLNLQCLSSRFWFWRLMWWAWELFCSVLRLYYSWYYYCLSQLDWALHCYTLSSSIFQMFHPLTYTCLVWIDIIVWKSDLPVSSMHTCTCQNTDQMSNSTDHYQTAPDLVRHRLLRYISVPIFGVNTVSYLAASVTNTTIYLSSIL